MWQATETEGRCLSFSAVSEEMSALTKCPVRHWKEKKMEKDKSFDSKILVNLVEYSILHLFSILQFIKVFDIW